MNDIITAIKDAIAAYPAASLMGMMLAAVVGALLLIAFGYRMIRAMSAVRQYDDACDKVKEIEEKVAAMQQEFCKDLADMKEEYARESFELQQIIFERNAEILDLKNRLIQKSKIGSF